MALIKPVAIVSGDAEVTIRSARPDDASQMLELYKNVVGEGSLTLVTQDEFSRTVEDEREEAVNDLPHPGRLKLVAETDGKVIGHGRIAQGGLKRTCHFSDIESIWVAPAYRRKGIADGIVKTLISWASEHTQIEKIGMFVFSTANPAIALYKKNGFTVEGVCPRDMKLEDGTYIDTVVMGQFVKPSA